MKMYKSKLERTMRSWIIIIILMIGLTPVNAQFTSDMFIVLDKDTVVQSFDLPELSEFIDAALENAASIRMQEAQIQGTKSQIKGKKMEWLDNFQLSGDARYGLYNYIFVSENLNDPGIAPTQNRFSYFLAFSIRIPFSIFTKTKQELNTLKHTVEAQQAQKDVSREELIQIVIEKYYAMLAARDLMISHQGAMQTVRSMYIKTINDINKGYKTNDDIMYVTEAKARVESNYFQSKYEFFKLAESLFALTGYKLKPAIQ